MYEVHFYRDADGNSFILLSHFMKSTQKTPKRESEKARRLMEDFRERSREDEY